MSPRCHSSKGNSGSSCLSDCNPYIRGDNRPSEDLRRDMQGLPLFFTTKPDWQVILSLSRESHSLLEFTRADENDERWYSNFFPPPPPSKKKQVTTCLYLDENQDRHHDYQKLPLSHQILSKRGLEMFRAMNRKPFSIRHQMHWFYKWILETVSVSTVPTKGHRARFRLHPTIKRSSLVKPNNKAWKSVKAPSRFIVHIISLVKVPTS